MRTPADGLPNRASAGLLGHRPGSAGLAGGLDASSPMAPLGRRASAIFEPPALQQQQPQGGSGATLRRLLVNNNHGGGVGTGGAAGGAAGVRRPFGSLGAWSAYAQAACNPGCVTLPGNQLATTVVLAL